MNFATSNGSATSGSDYNAASGTIAFGVGETSKTFVVAIIDDGAVEGAETINLTLSSPTGGATLGLAAAVLTIANNSDANTAPALGRSAPRPSPRAPCYPSRSRHRRGLASQFADFLGHEPAGRRQLRPRYADIRLDSAASAGAGFLPGHVRGQRWQLARLRDDRHHRARAEMRRLSWPRLAIGPRTWASGSPSRRPLPMWTCPRTR